MNIKIKCLTETATIPTYATDGSGCFDIYSDNLHDSYVFNPAVFSTGIAVEIPEGHVMLIFSRSGHGFNNNVRLSNSVGVIDADYRGEVKVKLACDDMDSGMEIKHGERIAQALVMPVQKVTFIEVDELSSTERGVGGFGSTGA